MSKNKFHNQHQQSHNYNISNFDRSISKNIKFTTSEKSQQKKVKKEEA